MGGMNHDCYERNSVFAVLFGRLSAQLNGLVTHEPVGQIIESSQERQIIQETARQTLSMERIETAGVSNTIAERSPKHIP